MKLYGRAISLMLAAVAAGCGQYGVSGPDDLGLATRVPFTVDKLPISLAEVVPNSASTDDETWRLARNQILNKWIVRSDSLCAHYQLQLSREIRDARLSTDVLATVLSGLATIFAKAATAHPLSGAATIALGIGGDIQSDLFLQQAADVVSTAIQSVRTRARTELEKKWPAKYADYTLEQGLVDVQRYDRETCNLNVGLNEIRASLNITGPVAPVANNPIIPLQPASPPGTPPAAAPPNPAPTALTVIPPTVTKGPNGAVVLTPGQAVSTPVMPPVVTPSPQPTPSVKRKQPKQLSCEAKPGDLAAHGLNNHDCSDFNALAGILNVPTAKSPSDSAFELAVMKANTEHNIAAGMVVTQALRDALQPGAAPQNPASPHGH